MVTKMTNPLSQYFRQPSIYIKLPSKGQFYPANALTMPANNELPILPMTAIDEIAYRTPDGLYNGSSTVNVIQSCCPSIKDAWNMPAMDLDTVLIGIRIASYGHEMEISTTCPNCGAEADHSLDLRSVLDQMAPVDYNQPLQFGDLTVFFTPMSFRQINANSAIQFEEQKLLSILPDSDLEQEQKTKMISEAFKKITDMTVEALTHSIRAIHTPTAQVNEQQYILDFLRNCDRTIFEKIRDYIIDLKSQTEIKPLHFKCAECSHEYDQAFSMEMSNFFG